MRRGSLTQKQIRFCNEYIIEPNATKAAINAGYSNKNARNIASKMLANVDIQEYIDIRMEQLAKQYQIKAQDVIRDLLNIKTKCIE
jgi:phage terminase small subunit